MRRSFGGGGGGTNMGGGMIRAVQRVVKAGVGGAPPESFSPSANTTSTTIGSANSRKAKSSDKKQPTSPNTALTLSSTSAVVNGANNNDGTLAFSSLVNLPLSSSSSLSCTDESDWEYVGINENERAPVFYEDYVFGSVPSSDEVHRAVSALQQFVTCSDEVDNAMGFEKQITSEMDWVEPSPHLCHSQMLGHYGLDRSVYDAFHLFETEPSVQRMVVSLSSDKAVWDAVLNNEAVKELKGSICQSADSLEEESLNNGSNGSNPADILRWIIVNTKAKLMQLMNNIMKLAFGLPNEEEEEEDDEGKSTDHPFQVKLKTSLLLSIVVLFIVVITRSRTL